MHLSQAKGPHLLSHPEQIDAYLDQRQKSAQQRRQLLTQDNKSKQFKQRLLIRSHAQRD